jgi:glycosyltransferase involved in cell wall biosynthesis
MTRLLFIAESFPPDPNGSARSASRLVQSLRTLGLEVDVFAWSADLLPGAVQRREGLYRMGGHPTWEPTLRDTLAQLDDLHHTQPYDAVWGHCLNPAGFVATWFGQLRGLPNVVSARGPDFERELPGDFARLRWTLERATVVTAVSQVLAHTIKTLVGRQDVMVIRSAVDPRLFAPGAPEAGLRKALGIAPEEVVLGFAGELREQKGQQFVLQALTRLRQDVPACLLLLGTVQPESAAVAYAAAHPKDALRVIVTGHLAEARLMARYLRLCDVLVLPSLVEGLPNVLLEAMACGVGCITSDVGGLPEVIEHGKTGFILPRQQLGELGEAVMAWLDLDPKEQSAIQLAGRQRILTDYSLAAEHLRLWAVLDRLLPVGSDRA